jgi:hypothetical protein
MYMNYAEGEGSNFLLDLIVKFIPNPNLYFC